MGPISLFNERVRVAQDTCRDFFNRPNGRRRGKNSPSPCLQRTRPHTVSLSMPRAAASRTAKLWTNPLHGCAQDTRPETKLGRILVLRFLNVNNY